MGSVSNGVVSKGQLSRRDKEKKKKKKSVVECREMFGFILEICVIHLSTFGNQH
jgi:hypothetical protein